MADLGGVDLSGLIGEFGDIPVVTDPGKILQKSRDFYWYSPVLKRQLEDPDLGAAREVTIQREMPGAPVRTPGAALRTPTPLRAGRASPRRSGAACGPCGRPCTRAR